MRYLFDIFATEKGSLNVAIVGCPSRYQRIFDVAYQIETLGNKVLYITHTRNDGKTLYQVICEIFYNIKQSDVVVAIPEEDGKFEDNTLYEIAFAKYIGKRVFKMREDNRLEELV